MKNAVLYLVLFVDYLLALSMKENNTFLVRSTTDANKSKTNTDESKTNTDENDCVLPAKKYLNSRIWCIRYPGSIVCKRVCSFGYTYSDGIVHNYTCKYHEKKWIPSLEEDTEECKPYIDCSLRLQSGGRLKCWHYFEDRGPICNITCSRFEDKPSVPWKEYECFTTGKWNPALPHCVERQGLYLVPSPAERHRQEVRLGNVHRGTKV